MQYIVKILVNMNDIIIEKLIENIEKTNENKSSHWKLLLPEEKKFKAAMQQIQKLKALAEPPCVIRIEKLLRN